MKGGARAEHVGLALAGGLVAEGERYPGDRRHLDAHQEHVLVPGWRHVAAGGLHHREAEPLGLHLAVAAAVGAEELAAGELEVAEVVRVVHDPHLVGVAVDDPHPRLEHRLLLSETVGVCPRPGQASRTRARARALRRLRSPPSRCLALSSSPWPCSPRPRSRSLRGSRCSLRWTRWGRTCSFARGPSSGQGSPSWSTAARSTPTCATSRR